MIQKLLGRLHHIFNKEPEATPALSVGIAGGGSVMVGGLVLSLTTPAGPATVDLDGKTLQQVVDEVGLLFPDYSPTFSRASTAYTSDGTQVAVDVPRIESTGMMVEEGTTNLVPSGALFFEGWTEWDGAIVTITQDQTVSEWNTNLATRLQSTGGSSLAKYFTTVVVPSANGQPYAVQVKVKNIGLNTVRVDTYIDASTIHQDVDPGEVAEIELHPTGDGSTSLRVQFKAIGGDDLDLMLFDLQVEAATYTTSWHDGTRAAESLTIPGTVFGLSEGTFEADVYIPDWLGTNLKNSVILGHGTGSLLNYIGLYHQNVSGQNAWVAEVGDGNGNRTPVTAPNALTPGTHRLAVAWHPNKLAIYIDGELAEDTPNPIMPSASPDDVRVGTWWDGSSPLNSNISAIRVSSRFRAEAELAAEAAEPLAMDSDTTYLSSLDGSGANGVVLAALANSSLGDRLARGLVEAKVEGAQADLDYPTSLLYQEMQVYAGAMDEQRKSRELAQAQVFMDRSSGEWLDYWGREFFGSPRYNGESDDDYVVRIAAEAIRANQNNVALEMIVKDALGVDVEIRDAYPNRSELPPEDQDRSPGYFLADMAIPNELSAEDAQALIDQIKDIVRRYKAGGTDFMDTVLRKLVQSIEDQAMAEALSTVITATINDSFQDGPVKFGGAWKFGAPGLKFGTNDAIKEQVLVTVLNASDDSVVSVGFGNDA